MEELETQLAENEEKIIIEQYKAQNQITREQVVNYLTHCIKQEPKLMLYTLIQKIILYDDKIEIFYNYTENNNPDDNNHRDYYFEKGSTDSILVEIKRLELSTYALRTHRSTNWAISPYLIVFGFII